MSKLQMTRPVSAGQGVWTAGQRINGQYTAKQQPDRQSTARATRVSTYDQLTTPTHGATNAGTYLKDGQTYRAAKAPTYVEQGGQHAHRPVSAGAAVAQAVSGEKKVDGNVLRLLLMLLLTKAMVGIRLSHQVSRRTMMS